jgi:hypothetical protein
MLRSHRTELDQRRNEIAGRQIKSLSQALRAALPLLIEQRDALLETHSLYRIDGNGRHKRVPNSLNASARHAVAAYERALRLGDRALGITI